MLRQTASIFTESERLSLLWLEGVKRVAGWNREAMPLLEPLWTLQFAGLDLARRAEGRALDAAGFGPKEQAYELAATGTHWRLRAYRGDDAPDAAPLLIVASPIKRSYIWDLAPDLSPTALCLRQGLRVYLLEWLEPAPETSGAGLADYTKAVVDAAALVAAATHGRGPFLMGHSLGGTVAAIAAARDPRAFGGLVLLGAPLCFEPAVSRFRDALVAAIPGDLSGDGFVPGSLLSYASAVASPQTFVWGRWLDAAVNAGDRRALEVHARIDRWALDEARLPARLVRDIVLGLYRDNSFGRGTLVLDDRSVGPKDLDLPVLVVQNTADDVAPPASIAPALRVLPTADACLLSYPGEQGCALQHLGLLVGQAAHAQLWPQIVAWLMSHETHTTAAAAA